ncbi:MAG TPA: hypothetical protein VL463_19950 [Kofleriaceae bacterium]|jgi:hypothetical protein|nr:hypothetical protein [Kofleriaceae bacterium]
MSGPVVAQQQPVPEEDIAPPQLANRAPDHALPEDIKLLLDVLEPHNADLLAKALRKYPQFHDQILAYVSQSLGNSIVQQALALLAQPDASPVAEAKVEPQQQAPAPEQAPTTAAPSAEQATSDVPAQNDPLFLVWAVTDAGDTELRFVADFIRKHPELEEAAMAIVTKHVGADFAARVRAELKGSGQPAATAQPQPEETPPAEVVTQAQDPAPAPQAVEAEPGWITRARQFNESNYAECEEFNRLTNFTCMSVALGGNAEIDPRKIADWQAANGVHPDGRVGAKTVEAARILAKRMESEQGPAIEEDLNPQLE